MNFENESMRAIIFEKACSPADLKISNTKMPLLKSDEILIKVKAFGLNFADILARTGNYPDAPDFPFIPGYEVSGDIVDFGEEALQKVEGLEKGDSVIAFTRFGGYSEYVTTKYYCALKKPDQISYEDAASIPV